MERLCVDLQTLIRSFAEEHIVLRLMREHPDMFLLWSKPLTPEINLEMEIHSKGFNCDIFLTMALLPKAKYKSEVYFFNVATTARWKLIRFDNILRDFWGHEEGPLTLVKGFCQGDIVNSRTVHVIDWQKVEANAAFQYSKTQMVSFGTT